MKKKLPKLSAVKRKANLLFSNFIRSRDKWKCVLCGSTENIQCGHLVKRGKKIHLFSEINCHAICSACNWKDNYDHDVYVLWFIKKYGVKEYDKLISTKDTFCPMKRHDYLSVIEKYKAYGLSKMRRSTV